MESIPPLTATRTRSDSPTNRRLAIYSQNLSYISDLFSTTCTTLSAEKTESRAAFYPAPGFRHAYYGTVYAVGYYGYCWASSISAGTYAFHLGFHFGGVVPNYSSYNADGLQLRCLQE